MNKTEFLAVLSERLGGMPKADREERLAFYGEMIEDRMEDGATEDEAVAAIGNVDEVSALILQEIPLAKLVKERIKPKSRLKGGEIALLIIGSPIWGSLLIAAFAVLFSLYVSVWAVIVLLWAAFVSLLGSAVGCIALVVICAGMGNLAMEVAGISAVLILVGVSIFAFIGCKSATKGFAIGTKRFVLWLKNTLAKKEDAE